MKKQIDSSVASRLINCGMVVLVSCGHKGKRNITTCAWQMPVSKEPPLVAVALAKKHFSSSIIKESGELVINVPSWSYLDKVMLCGRLKGRETDKFKDVGFNPVSPSVLKEAPSIKECVASLECKVANTIEAGDHFIFIAEVVYAEALQDYFYNDMWDISKVEFIFHLGKNFFFKSSLPCEVSL